ncbi:MAG: class I SAM-dependent methyltransferase, partial [Opitutaceae bacterium]
MHCLREILGKLFRGEDVLEVACGTGYWTKALARTARSVFATDVSERVLTLARTKNYGNATVNFLKADCYALPQFDALFTAGFGAFWWSRIPRVRLREFMTDFHSHLAAGAKVAFIDHRYFEGRSTPLFRAGVNGEADTFQMRTLHDGHVHKVRKNFPSPEELTEVVGEFGRDIEVTLF